MLTIDDLLNPMGNDDLRNAIRRGDINRVALLLKNGSDPNLMDDLGNTALDVVLDSVFMVSPLNMEYNDSTLKEKISLIHTLYSKHGFASEIKLETLKRWENTILKKIEEMSPFGMSPEHVPSFRVEFKNMASFKIRLSERVFFEERYRCLMIAMENDNVDKIKSSLEELHTILDTCTNESREDLLLDFPAFNKTALIWSSPSLDPMVPDSPPSKRPRRASN